MNELVNYIKESFVKGLKKPQIEAELTKAGWSKDQVDSAFYSVEFEQKQFLQQTQRRFLPSKKPLIIIIIILFSFGFIFQLFLYVDIANKCFIKIIPSIAEWNNLNIKRAVKILKYGSPSDYKDFCTHVDTINGVVACGGFEGGCFYGSQPKTIYISSAQEESTIAFTVGVIVHETCHAMQYDQGRPGDENECYKEDDRLMRKIVQL